MLVPQPLPRYVDDALERVAWERKLASILLEVGEPAPAPRAFRGVTSAGDERRLRGLPAVARGVSGAVRGSNPTVCLDPIDRERRNGRRGA
ncbi:MAG: hypothetical protein K0T00_2487 [Gaiellaceae bacterium]|nr:hypothetical protein [Gaiellaceae bacterium]